MQIKIVLVSLGLVSPIVSAAAISLPMLSKAVVMSVFSPLVSAAVVVDKNKVYETEGDSW